MLSWEYPPVVVGGLARHVHGLARGLARGGTDVTVYTRGDPGGPGESLEEGVRVVRVPRQPPRIRDGDFIRWTLGLNEALLDRASSDVRDRRPDVVHGHDWLVAYASAALRDLTDAPLVVTVHATEHGRHRGNVAGPMQRFVHQVEGWLTSEASRVITCSAYMRDEVVRIFDVPDQKVETIPNEVEVHAAPSVAPPGDGGPVILFAGRLEHEKGVQTLLEAMPQVVSRVRGARLVVAGRGNYQPELERLAVRLNVRSAVRFAGFVGQEHLRALYASADLVAVPSLYEPFGLVALEAMASGTPVVASDTGGLRELVREGVTGLRFRPGDAGSLGSAVVRVLADPGLGARLAREARSMVARRGSWDAVAARTAEVYRRATEAPGPSAPLTAVTEGDAS